MATRKVTFVACIVFPLDRMLQIKNWLILSVKGLTVNIFSFDGHYVSQLLGLVEIVLKENERDCVH